MRALIVIGAGLGLVVLLGLGGWLWYSATQTRGLTAYAEALTRAHESQTPRAPAQARGQAIRELEGVLAEYPTSPAAVEAAYELGNLRYASGEYPTARGAFEIALAKGATGTFATLARAGIAYTWEAERKFSEAESAFQAALGGSGPKDFLFEELMLGLARNQELTGRKDAAVATYQRLLKESPKARRSDVVRARLATLGAAPKP
jgi:tetratricopeptide (TPR) repeat protein